MKKSIHSEGRSNLLPSLDLAQKNTLLSTFGSIEVVAGNATGPLILFTKARVYIFEAKLFL